jgi:RNA polymerase sigma-70 factor (ECF subfamily)
MFRRTNAKEADTNRDALEQLLDQAKPLAYRFGVMVCGNASDAEDAMQDALLQTFRRADRIREPGAFRAWLYRTVKNACLMSRRRRVRQPPRLLSLDDDETLQIAAPSRTPEDLAVAADTRRRLVRAFRLLPKRYRLIVFLRDLEGLSTEETAEVAGISADSVKQRLHRGRRMLRTALAAVDSAR